MLVLYRCASHDGTEKESHPSPGADLVKVNKYLVKKDQTTIANYIARRGWKMQQTQTGLWYMIFQHGEGTKARKGQNISLAYKEYLLDGTLCYSSDSLGIKNFCIGKGNVESGLEEGVLFLREGDKARFILPPHLAFGLLGDEKKIPARAIIIYEMEVIGVKDCNASSEKK
jgi:FKBP-type peptidyl-prolyl cis-trans isomerase